MSWLWLCPNQDSLSLNEATSESSVTRRNLHQSSLTQANLLQQDRICTNKSDRESVVVWFDVWNVNWFSIVDNSMWQISPGQCQLSMWRLEVNIIISWNHNNYGLWIELIWLSGNGNVRLENNVKTIINQFHRQSNQSIWIRIRIMSLTDQPKPGFGSVIQVQSINEWMNQFNNSSINHKNK